MWGLTAFFAWVLISQLIWPPQPPTEPDAATTQPADDAVPSSQPGSADATSASDGGQPAPSATVETPSRYRAEVAEDQAEATPIVLGGVEGHEQSHYRMRIELTSAGASVRSVRLADFAKGVDEADRYPLLDPVTAVSGGGPAYVFLLIETLAEAGVAAGLPADLSMRIARATVAGAGELVYRAEQPASKLRENVTSPGGTTLEALKVLMAPDGLQPLMTRAIAAATKRSRELET